MKPFRRTLALVLIAAVIVTSCSSHDETFNPLAGTWTLKGISCQNCIDKTQITSTTYSCSDSSCNRYTFNPDGSMTVVEVSSGISKESFGTYSISGTTVTVRLNKEGHSTRVYSFTRSGEMLYLKEVIDETNGRCGATTVLGK